MGRKLISEADGRECSAVEVAMLAGYKNNDPAMVYQHVARGTPIAGHQWRWSDEPANGHDVLASGDPWGARILRTCSDDAEYTPFVEGVGGYFQDWQPVNPNGPGILGREVGLPRRHYSGGI